MQSIEIGHRGTLNKERLVFDTAHYRSLELNRVRCRVLVLFTLWREFRYRNVSLLVAISR